MEKFTLYSQNGVHYIEKDNKKILFSYSQPFSVFAENYLPIQINNKPIIDDKKTPLDKLTNSLEGMMGGKVNLPFDSLQEGIKSMLSDNSMLDMLKKMGIDTSVVDKMKNMDLDDKNLLGDFLEIFSKKAGITFDLILGKDILDQFMVLINYEKSEVTFFTDREEVGKEIGTSFHIKNLVDNHLYYIPNLLTVGGLECSVALSSSLKNIFATKKIFFKIMDSVKTLPETKIETDFLGELGTVNETFFKFNLEAQNFEKEGWIAKLPDITDSMLQGVSNIDLIMPLSFFSSGVLIDGINKKFGYKKNN